MNPAENSDNQKWIDRLEREAKNQLPPFSPALHDQIMRKAAQPRLRAATVARGLSAWSAPRSPYWQLASVAVALAVALGIWMQFRAAQPVVPKPAVSAFHISYVLPDTGSLIQQAAAQWQHQFAGQSFAGLQTQARQLSQYVVGKMTLF